MQSMGFFRVQLHVWRSPVRDVRIRPIPCAARERDQPGESAKSGWSFFRLTGAVVAATPSVSRPLPLTGLGVTVGSASPCDPSARRPVHGNAKRRLLLFANPAAPDLQVSGQGLCEGVGRTGDDGAPPACPFPQACFRYRRHASAPAPASPIRRNRQPSARRPRRSGARSAPERFG